MGVGKAFTTIDVRRGRGVTSSSLDSIEIGSSAVPDRVVVVTSRAALGGALGGVTRFLRGDRRCETDGVDASELAPTLELRDDDVCDRAARPRLLGEAGGEGEEDTMFTGDIGSVWNEEGSLLSSNGV